MQQMNKILMTIMSNGSVMKQVLIISLITILFHGCENYENKDKYVVKVGESVEIYYSSNSCCYYCISNSEELVHVYLKETLTVDTGPEDCAGCNYTYALVFMAESVGVDTIELKSIQASKDCDSSNVIPQKFIIEVR